MRRGVPAALVVLVVGLACGGSSTVLDRSPRGGLAATPEPPLPPLALTERVPLPVDPEACGGPVQVAFMAARGSALHVVWSTAVGTTCWARLDATRRWRGARELAFETVAFGLVGGRPVFVTTTGGTSLCTGSRPTCRVLGRERPEDVVFGPRDVLLDYGLLVVRASIAPTLRLVIDREPVQGSPVGSFDHRAGPCGDQWAFVSDDGVRVLGAPDRRYAPRAAFDWPPARGLHVIRDRSYAFGADGVAVDVCSRETLPGPPDTAGFMIATSWVGRGRRGLATLRRWTIEDSRWFQYDYAGAEHRFQRDDDASMPETGIFAAALDERGDLWLMVGRDAEAPGLERWSGARR